MLYPNLKTILNLVAKYQNEGRKSPMRGWSMTDIVSKIEKRLGKHAGQIARDYIINQTFFIGWRNNNPFFVTSQF